MLSIRNIMSIIIVTENDHTLLPLKPSKNLQHSPDKYIIMALLSAIFSPSSTLIVLFYFIGDLTEDGRYSIYIRKYYK